MALIPTQQIVVAGTAPTPAAAANGDTCRVGSHLTLEVFNTAGSSMTVTLTPPSTLNTGVAYPAKVYTVAATTGQVRIPLLSEYADPTTGLATVVYSTVTSVTRMVTQSQ
jgi:hypothetical protein